MNFLKLPYNDLPQGSISTYLTVNFLKLPYNELSKAGFTNYKPVLNLIVAVTVDEYKVKATFEFVLLLKYNTATKENLSILENWMRSMFKFYRK